MTADVRVVRFEANFEGWRPAARTALLADTSPDEVLFVPMGSEAVAPVEETLFGAVPSDSREAGAAMDAQSSEPEAWPPSQDVEAMASAKRVPRVPPGFLEQARLVSYHRDEGKWHLLYRLLWRVTREGAEVLDQVTDSDVRAFLRMHRAVRIDDHAMQAFVRFHPVEVNGLETYVAWHRTAHPILRLGAPFFVRRFPRMPWAIFTEEESATWDTQQLRFGPGAPQPASESQDGLTDLWRTYFGAIFNPSRLNADLFRRKIPKRNRDALPELRDVEQLIAQAPQRAEEMKRHAPASARAHVPVDGTLEDARNAARGCRGCPLFHDATQTVFGVGPEAARMALVGEQPGDEEDVHGLPFVGPAGRLLDEALAAAGLDREALYLTNAVKHFKWKPAPELSGAGEASGKKRLHVRPGQEEVTACRPWLEREFTHVRPDVIVALGQTAAQSLLGRSVGIERERGSVVRSRFCAHTILTFHPSALLRAPSEERRAQLFAWLVQDLALAATLVSSGVFAAAALPVLTTVAGAT